VGLTLKPLKWNWRSHYSSNQRSPVRLLPVRSHNFLGTNLDCDFKQIESFSWTLSWSLAWFLVLRITSSPFSTIFWSEPMFFPPKQVPCRFSLNLPFLVLDPHLNSWVPDLGLDPRLKSPLGNTVNQHPLVHHPLDASYHLVVYEPQLNWVNIWFHLGNQFCRK